MLEPIKELEFLEDKHYYKVRGKYIPSVSSVIRPIANMIYGDIDKDVLKKAADRGVEIHLAIEIYDITGAEVISDEYRGYFDGYKRFRAEYPQLEVIANEYRVYEPTLWYAGTIDKLYRNKDNKKIILTDIKTSFAVEMCTVIPQLTGYERAAAAHGIESAELRVLHLKNDGSYEFIEIKPNIELFISCLSIQNHINKHKRGA